MPRPTPCAASIRGACSRPRRRDRMTVIPATAPKRPRLRGASVGPFPLITLVLVIVIGLAAFVTATYLEMFGDGGGEPRTNGPSSYSRSAIGHRAFAATLRNLDLPVQLSRFR